jgi:signal transduction histidine kinase
MDEFSTFYQTKAQKEEFLLIDSIFNIVEILSSKIILKRLKIVYEIEENLKISSYEHIISNIFLVLINNSLEAFGSGDDNNIKISAKQNENETVITYEDNAGGIKIKPIEAVFDYFVSAKEDKKSSGIGLAVVKLLVNERLNGKISVKNSNNGVIFTVIIPQ